jgi:hypothetical protein
MGSSSSPPPPPPPQAPIPPPTIVDPSVQQNEQRDLAKRKRGRAATILSGAGGMGDVSIPLTATQVLGGTRT